MHVHAQVIKPDSGSVCCQWIVENDRKGLPAISATAVIHRDRRRTSSAEVWPHYEGGAKYTGFPEAMKAAGWIQPDRRSGLILPRPGTDYCTSFSNSCRRALNWPRRIS